ncbi:MAG: hypothetical protein SWY16_25540 [Cyanobacteriota bacterium]|nr:hypothetical protein [Cyanobacteriota bacterium]
MKVISNKFDKSFRRYFRDEVIATTHLWLKPIAFTQNRQRIDLDGDEMLALAIAIDATVKITKKDGWRDSKPKQREVRAAIKKHLPNSNNETVNRILEIVKNQREY